MPKNNRKAVKGQRKFCFVHSFFHIATWWGWLPDENGVKQRCCGPHCKTVRELKAVKKRRAAAPRPNDALLTNTALTDDTGCIVSLITARADIRAFMGAHAMMQDYALTLFIFLFGFVQFRYFQWTVAISVEHIMISAVTWPRNGAECQTAVEDLSRIRLLIEK
jgi:hypothetical protein